MKRAHKRALRFALDVMQGAHQELDYIHHAVPENLRRPAGPQRRHWIEPDRDPDRPYLNETFFTDLELRGYLERQRFPTTTLWIYRITPEGCAVLGETYPLYHRYTLLLPRVRQRPFPHPTQDPRELKFSHRYRRSRMKDDPYRHTRQKDYRGRKF